MLNDLDPSDRKASNIEQNDTKVAKMPIDMPNNGRLN